MWQAAICCDEKYDGKFFYGVKTVGVYCRPSCRSRTPLRRNVCFFMTEAEAGSAGFRPCKRCRPDLPDFSPSAELANKTQQLINEHFCEHELLDAALNALGISKNRINVVFKERFGVTVSEYIAGKKAERAKQLLNETDLPIIEVSAIVGFDSLSAFYSFFKRKTGKTPFDYRASTRSKIAK